MRDSNLDALVLDTVQKLAANGDVSAADVIEALADQDISPNAIKETIWRLADLHRIHFTHGRRLAPDFDYQAA